MRSRAAAAILVCLASAAPARAGDTPGGDVFAGYSLLRLSDGTATESFNGWEGSLAKNFGSLAAVADFSGHYKSGSSDLTFMAGPRFAVRGKHVMLFAQALAGGIHTTSGITVLGVTISESDTTFAWTVGGGLSLRVNAGWDVRVQADYLNFKQNGQNQGNLRLAAGLAHGLGKR